MREGEEGEEDGVGREKKKELGEMLREVFRLPEVEEVVAEMPCWLLRSICESARSYSRQGWAEGAGRARADLDLFGDPLWQCCKATCISRPVISASTPTCRPSLKYVPLPIIPCVLPSSFVGLSYLNPFAVSPDQGSQVRSSHQEKEWVDRLDQVLVSAQVWRPQLVRVLSRTSFFLLVFFCARDPSRSMS
jgi:hypothetical protein